MPEQSGKNPFYVRHGFEVRGLDNRFAAQLEYGQMRNTQHSRQADDDSIQQGAYACDLFADSLQGAQAKLRYTHPHALEEIVELVSEHLADITKLLHYLQESLQQPSIGEE